MKQIVGRVLPGGFFLLLVAARHDSIANSLDALSQSTDAESAARAAVPLLHALLSALFYLLLAALFVGRLPTIKRMGGAVPTMLAIAGTFGTLPFALTPRNDDPTLASIADILIAVGLAGSCVTVKSLGRQFGIRPGARALVTQGPYRWIRHPLYVFEAITQAGILLVVLAPLSVATFVVYVLIQYRRALLEERVLEETFPAYREYRVRTPRFIPSLVWPRIRLQESN